MLVSVVAFLAASTAQAAEPPSPAPATQTPPAKEKKICRTDQLIGSMIPKRVCKTKLEWDGQSVAKPPQDNTSGQQPAQSSGSGSNN
jgi:hypothetical protein